MLELLTDDKTLHVSKYYLFLDIISYTFVAHCQHFNYWNTYSTLLTVHC